MSAGTAELRVRATHGRNYLPERDFSRAARVWIERGAEFMSFPGSYDAACIRGTLPESCFADHHGTSRRTLSGTGDVGANSSLCIGIGILSNSYLQQALASALQSAGITSKTGTATGASSTSSTQSDSSQLSSFAQLARTLQQLQQSNPAQYASVTKQIATNLRSAASTAQSQGNSSAASQLNQLAGDFTTASQTGQLPNLQDLSQAVTGSGGRHHHHHHGGGDSSSSAATSDPATDSTGSTSSSATSSSSQALSQLLSALQTNDSQSSSNSSLNPRAIILQTLSSAGINHFGQLILPFAEH